MSQIPLPPVEVRRRNLVFVAVTATLVYAADLITKILAVAKLEDGTTVELVGDLFQLDFTRNGGAAFGIGVGMTVVFSLLSLIVIGVVLRTANRLGSTGWALVFGLVLGGALGNLTDRIFRSPGFMRGHVVDFLHLKNWPVFNLADTAFCIAGGIVFLLVLRNIPLEGRNTS
ncbi:signal peptidase II [Sporichthya sp.]|uniref:signal peptidase II n=1 Tax=Sporichthya sp. TaxID=65475 RepID=UPI0018066A4F|nr:signal peptidase II [Sporichthya sp.]MBA3744214.1 signal peptidase II [Sporichthya sp.]